MFVDCEVTGFAEHPARDAPLRSRGAEPIDSVAVVTSRGTIDARCVVLAAGAWVQSLGHEAGASPRSFTPIHRHLFVTEPIADLDRDAPFVWHLGAEELYVRPEGSGYLISGCDETAVEPHDARVAPGAIDQLAAKLIRVAPRLAELGIARSWACLRTFSETRRPVVDWDAARPWLLWVAGLGGHGATASAAIGESAAAKLLARV